MSKLSKIKKELKDVELVSLKHFLTSYKRIILFAFGLLLLYWGTCSFLIYPIYDFIVGVSASTLLSLLLKVFLLSFIFIGFGSASILTSVRIIKDDEDEGSEVRSNLKVDTKTSK